MDPWSFRYCHSFLFKAANLMKKAKGGEEKQRGRQAGREPLEQQAFFDVQR